MPTHDLNAHRAQAERTAELQRSIQRELEQAEHSRKDANGGQQKNGQAVQAGAREQPQNPFPAQHLEKPGRESDLRPHPSFTAPAYKGSEKLKDKVAIVTGGDSGIGRAVAVLFAREGADVAILYLNEHEDAEVTQRAVEAESRRALCISGDVRDADFCEAAVEKVVQELGHLDVLVNNAAFQLHAPSLDLLSETHLDMTVRTNLYGYFHMTKAALKHLKRGASIINTGSETGLFGAPGLIDYAATKGGIHAFTKSLATRLAPQGIRVNVVAPGPVWTPLNPSDRPADKVPEFGSGTDMKRPAQPEEIAPAYVFLAAPACSSYITGIELPVMGGVHGSG
ncbi:MAG: SDR family oxidoreductase [Steroidobacteraceae bacterium]|nr:SDR family oxidoreductase [Steroidobacteraceae bacterium]